MQVVNPQRALFKEHYCNPESETFGNAKGSAIKAGFSEVYANKISAPSNSTGENGLAWLAEIIRDVEMQQKAEKVLDEMLVMDVYDEVVYTTPATKTTKKKTTKIKKKNPAIVKIKQDTAKFVSERLNKPKWAPRTELTGAGGAKLVPSKADQDDADSALTEFLNGNENTSNTKQPGLEKEESIT